MYGFTDSLIMPVLLLEGIKAQTRMIHIFGGLDGFFWLSASSSVTVLKIFGY